MYRCAYIQMTSRCNMACRHCLLSVFHLHDEQAREMSSEDALRVIDKVVGLGVDEVHLTGGEILLRQDLPVIATYIRDRNVECSLPQTVFCSPKALLGHCSTLALGDLS